MTTFLFYNYKKRIIITSFLILLMLLSHIAYASVQEASTAPPFCGNNIKETGEQCDGSDLGGVSCANLGYFGGTLSCNPDCTFNTSGCTTAPPPPRPGVGIPPIPLPPILPPKPTLPTGDFNNDGLINFRDLSILLYWFGRTGPEIIPYDLNQDGKINYVDVSILLYRWRE